MTAKTIADQKKTPAPTEELETGELDQVTGGMKPTGGLKSIKPKTIIGDPCEGGE